MELKLRQYRLGKAFCDAVVAEAGTEALNGIWQGPEALPAMAELERPLEWLAPDRRAGARLTGRTFGLNRPGRWGYKRVFGLVDSNILRNKQVSNTTHRGGSKKEMPVNGTSTATAPRPRPARRAAPTAPRSGRASPRSATGASLTRGTPPSARSTSRSARFSASRIASPTSSSRSPRGRRRTRSSSPFARASSAS